MSYSLFQVVIFKIAQQLPIKSPAIIAEFLISANKS
jgi:hypothetical protein